MTAIQSNCGRLASAVERRVLRQEPGLLKENDGGEVGHRLYETILPHPLTGSNWMREGRGLRLKEIHGVIHIPFWQAPRGATPSTQSCLARANVASDFDPASS